MGYIMSNIPYFKVWVRREYTVNFERYLGEFLHGMAIAVTTLPMKTLSFQILFTGEEDPLQYIRDPVLDIIRPVIQFLDTLLVFSCESFLYKMA